jgi:hypothetical protein
MLPHPSRTHSSRFCTLAFALIVLGLIAAPAVAQQLVPYGGPLDGWPGYSWQAYLSDTEGQFSGDQATFPFDEFEQLIPCNSLFFDNRGPDSPVSDGVWDPVLDTEDSPWFSVGGFCTPPCDVGFCEIFLEEETPWRPGSLADRLSDLYVCYTLPVCEGGEITGIDVAIDNDVMVWVNGEPGIPGAGQCSSPDDPDGISDDGLCMTEGCAQPDKVTFTNPAWVTGATNTIHVRARDRHALAYLDIEVNGDPGNCPTGCPGSPQ